MKKTLTVVAVFLLLTVFLPAAVLFSAPGKQTVPMQQPEKTAPPQTEVPVLDSTTGRVETFGLREYLIGAVASEMPVSYQPEALKAQAVAVHSYLLACRDLQAQNPDPALKGAWLQADPSKNQGYMPEKNMAALWGDDFARRYAYLAQQVDAVLDMVLYDGDLPALATYYAISNGRGEASENVWSSPVSYLTAIDLPWDKQAAGYEETVQFSIQEMADALGMNFHALDLSCPAENWFGAAERTPSGYVLRQACGGQLLKGTDLRSALGLRSADFTITSRPEGLFTVTTRGYGHGVGLSQHAANAMALEGKTYEQILAYCYPGTTLRQIAG